MSLEKFSKWLQLELLGFELQQSMQILSCWHEGNSGTSAESGYQISLLCGLRQGASPP